MQNLSQAFGYSSDIDITNTTICCRRVWRQSSKDLTVGALVANGETGGGVCQNKWNRVIAGRVSGDSRT